MVSKHHSNAITQTSSNDEPKASTYHRTNNGIVERIVGSHCRISTISNVLGEEQ